MDDLPGGGFNHLFICTRIPREDPIWHAIWIASAKGIFSDMAEGFCLKFWRKVIFPFPIF